jgi:23S rRNA pseudouridine1911/1915/1917 synthase
VVQRLDRPVSGVVLFARTSKAASRLARAFREGGAEKVYWGVVQGVPADEAGEVEHWLEKDSTANRARVVAAGTPDARLARSAWRLLERGAGCSLLELRPFSGRAHQLRVACASLGCPLLGDLKYGAAEPLSDRSVALHARLLSVVHPTRSERMRFEAYPPATTAWTFSRCARLRGEV